MEVVSVGVSAHLNQPVEDKCCCTDGQTAKRDGVVVMETIFDIMQRTLGITSICTDSTHMHICERGRGERRAVNTTPTYCHVKKIIMLKLFAHLHIQHTQSYLTVHPTYICLIPHQKQTYYDPVVEINGTCFMTILTS